MEDDVDVENGEDGEGESNEGDCYLLCYLGYLWGIRDWLCYLLWGLLGS